MSYLKFTWNNTDIQIIFMLCLLVCVSLSHTHTRTHLTYITPQSTLYAHCSLGHLIMNDCFCCCCMYRVCVCPMAAPFHNTLCLFALLCVINDMSVLRLAAESSFKDSCWDHNQSSINSFMPLVESESERDAEIVVLSDYNLVLYPNQSFPIMATNHLVSFAYSTVE